MVSDLSIITGFEGYDEICSLSEFRKCLKVDLSSNECKNGWVFWRSQQLKGEYELAAADDEELDDISPFGLLFPRVEIDDKIKRVLEEMTSQTREGKYLAQFWAPEQVGGQQLYLSTSDQPFGVGRQLRKGLRWYRKRCMCHAYRVDEGAQGEEFGAVGRVYRNKHPESSPDVRLYSTKEFPLRDFAAGCGVRAYLALPVFDLPKEICYGVIEVLFFDKIGANTLFRELGLKDVDGEITEMLELAIRVMTQLQMAQVWVPCHECSSTSNSLRCMKRAAFIEAGNEKVNSLETVNDHMANYIEACHLHHLQIGNYTNMIAAVMSSKNKSCICRDICDLSISENPLAHYAQKARLSFCFAIYLQSSHNSRDFYVVEFFLQFSSREDAFAGSVLPLLLRIMEMKLKSFKFVHKGQHGEELVVGVLRGNILSSGESCHSNALGYESFKCKHQHSEDLSMLMVMEGCKESYSLLDLKKYLQKSDLHSVQLFVEHTHGWVFHSQARQELLGNDINSNSSLVPNQIQEKIKHLMKIITSGDSYSLAQFWAPKMDGGRCYLETSGQPFALGCLHKGLAFFRKQCMEHYYFVDEMAKEQELGPPGRVFLKRHLEITPDLHLYSPTEFPLRNHAAYCGLRKYVALPVFELYHDKCLGVLELVEFSDSTPEFIEDAFKAANLSSTHVNFWASFTGSHLQGNNAALIEIKEACKLFAEIPQLDMVNVWVPCSKCASINNNLSYMELVLATTNIQELYKPICEIQHVETRKGIVGMALASENKSCLSRNLCEFSITEYLLAHYVQHARLGVCFAICLQSWHTGDLLYVLEFYLNQGPGKYEYLRSFLCLLLKVMKKKFESFKVASGQQLGEKLVVEVIEFSEVNELAFSELDQPDMSLITFKFVKYLGQRHSKVKEVQFAPDSMESLKSVGQAKHWSTSAANLKRKDATKETKGRKRKTNLNINLEDLKPYFGLKLKDVTKELGVSKSTIKRRVREYGIQMWPWNKNYFKNHSL